jgi:hypothetical protein
MAEPKRPIELRVGYLHFTVEYLSDQEWEKRGLDGEDGGQTNGSACTIVIRDSEGMNEIHVKEILLHEVLHACFYSSGMTIEASFREQRDIEEYVVGRCTPVLLQTFRDNPDLSLYLES